MLAFRARPLPRTALRARRAAHAKRSATRSSSRASQKSGAASRMCWPSAPRAVFPFAPARQRLQPLQRASLALTLTANAPRSPMRAEVSFECRGPANASKTRWHQAHAARAPEHTICMATPHLLLPTSSSSGRERRRVRNGLSATTIPSAASRCATLRRRRLQRLPNGCSQVAMAMASRGQAGQVHGSGVCRVYVKVLSS